MSKLTKTLIWVVGLVFLTLMGSLMATHAVDALLPAELQLLKSVPRFANLNGYIRGVLANYIFWAALILFVVALVALLVISFWPRTRTDLALTNQGDTLALNKSAIEGVVKSVVEANDYMKNPKVSVKLHKKKFKVHVKGDIVPRYEVAEKAKRIKSDVERSLKEFVGLDYPMTFTVEVKQARQPKSQPRTGRVE